MTENEAVKNIKALNAVCWHKDFYDEEFAKALANAITALEEIQQCREFEKIFKERFSDGAIKLLSDKEEFGKWLERGKWIAKRCDEINRELEKFNALGTVEELREAMEKHRAKKPVFLEKVDENKERYLCGYCGMGMYYYLDKEKKWKNNNFCPKCGNLIDWVEEE